jgi:hypothetical protein
MPVITLLTDFGLADSYVAEVKGVLLSRAPGAMLVDVTHQVPPGDVRAGQYLLARAWHRFPPGTVHFAIVDPGVGTARRALAAAAGEHWFVAPDNGLLSFLPALRFVSLPIPSGAAPTFHGRDVFAPAAAALAGGTPLERLGSPVTDAIHVPLPTPHHDGTALMGEVVYVDRFGTLISNIPGPDVEPGVRIRIGGGTDVGPLRRTFGDVERGTLVAFVGSGGTVEVAVRDGSAARLLGVGVGAEVRA